MAWAERRPTQGCDLSTDPGAGIDRGRVNPGESIQGWEGVALVGDRLRSRLSCAKVGGHLLAGFEALVSAVKGLAGCGAARRPHAPGGRTPIPAARR